jgi:hypothetical protein
MKTKYKINEYGVYLGRGGSPRIQRVEIVSESEKFVTLPKTSSGYRERREAKGNLWFDSFEAAKDAWVQRCMKDVEYHEEQLLAARKALAEAEALTA